ncbi:alpha/beta fold hydrolase [Desulfobotulus sp. H1]|uniref:Alpha/beta fold hydrolase n=1 Tax=Desulfobotulus pelophilus TaxID=2823377 RepID=A0ABT3N9Z1_9BACT|nr:alpha/beta fold hydrolase [Desulfobotulus pelophilus]MCW7754280.1 alpha/beta fold hydrolase [Desulfobotulus pelophilus]
MNRFAFLSTTFALKRLYHLSNARTHISGKEHIPPGPVIFTVNHFTRIETLILPYLLEEITGRPIWSLAHHSLFTGAMAGFLEKGGAVSTAAPDRDRLILKSLLKGDAHWVIFPEGSMVKSKKVVAEDAFLVDNGEGKNRPKTGAANLALRAEFYRQRIRGCLMKKESQRAGAICDIFDIMDPEEIGEHPVCIVPVNITYYPLRVRENALNRLAAFLVDALPQRVNEELMTEGSMLLDGVDVDIRLGRPLEVGTYLQDPVITADIASPKFFGPDDAIASRQLLRQSAFQLMQDYMAAIYAMTTVNPDHLFASLVREMPGDIIDIEDLRRRVYLAAAQRLDAKRLYLHKSLDRSQIHLITDDRFGRCADFLRYAQDRGVLSLTEDGKLLRHKEKFQADYDFHDIRVTNPIAVMANEIEPLSILRPHIQRLARETPFHIRRRLVSHLLEKGVRSFEDSRSRFGTDAALQNREGGRPFLLEGRQGKMGILLIHGYLGVPEQMRHLGEKLQKEGFWVYALRLPGHGTTPEDLEKTVADDWEEAVFEGYALLHVLCGHVAVAGISLGALLACLLAVRIPGLTALCLAGMPVKIQDYRLCADEDAAFWDRILSRFRGNKKNRMRLPCGRDEEIVGYAEHSETSFRELARMTEKAGDQLGLILQPCMVLQAAEDPLVAREAAATAFQRLKTDRKELHRVDGKHHDVLGVRGSDRVQAMVVDYFVEWGKTTADQSGRVLPVGPGAFPPFRRRGAGSLSLHGNTKDETIPIP